ncbi:unnamed protein product [Nesidiocoris tenuis]|uniref:Uncharacterized protein n=1 Tax=Nesidiocoris tenuis TaxID=355587 RepID=A0A6H5HN91_9HEMI|nr:unnamed protein product [Nesidiocoris tenuis]
MFYDQWADSEIDSRSTNIAARTLWATYRTAGVAPGLMNDKHGTSTTSTSNQANQLYSHIHSEHRRSLSCPSATIIHNRQKRSWCTFRHYFQPTSLHGPRISRGLKRIPAVAQL